MNQLTLTPKQFFFNPHPASCKTIFISQSQPQQFSKFITTKLKRMLVYMYKNNATACTYKLNLIIYILHTYVYLLLVHKFDNHTLTLALAITITKLSLVSSSRSGTLCTFLLFVNS